MKHLTFKKNGVEFIPIKHWKTDFLTEVAIYQGNRGQTPDLDFIVKYREDGKRLRAPSHTHWIVDLLVKGSKSTIFKCDYLGRYVDDLIKIYDESNRFESIQERQNYVLKYPKLMASKYPQLQGEGYYSIETLTAFIELFSKCEKQTDGAFMFKGLLTLVKEYCEGKKDFYQVVGLSKRV